MKIVLYQFVAELYFKNENEWTCNREEALDFGNLAQAQKFISEHRNTHLDIMLYHDDPVLKAARPN